LARAVGAAAVVAASTGSIVASTAATAQPAAAATTCNLGNGIQHVIHITFDNVHFFRDNPNVPSDVEQMPTLMNFLQNNGSLLSNQHTPLISHTANDSLTEYSGLYGDRHGMGISNSYEYYNGTAVNSADSFVYWTSPIIDHGSQAPSATDPNPSMIYSQQVPPVAVPSATTGHAAIAPAPWAPFTKAGCTVGNVSTANMVLEKYADIPTVFGSGSPEAAQLAADSTTFKNVETDDYIGLSLHCGQPAAVNDPTCTNAQAVKYNQTTPSPTAVADTLVDEPGGYNNFVAVHGSRYLTPVLGGAPSIVRNGYPVTDANGNLTDLDGNTIYGAFKDIRPGQTTAQFNPGFPGFSPTASQSLAYVPTCRKPACLSPTPTSPTPTTKRPSTGSAPNRPAAPARATPSVPPTPATRPTWLLTTPPSPSSSTG
jgi:hypothetical protein